MTAATWVLVGGTVGLFLTSLVAVITWRENRRRDRDERMAQRIIETARKEFAPKEELGGLKSNLIGAGVFALLVGLVIYGIQSGKLE